MSEKDPFELAEKILLYRNGLLDETESQLFEEEIRANPALKELVDELDSPEKSSQELRQFVSFDSQQAYKQALDTVYPTRRMSFMRYGWVAASIVTVAALTALFFFRSTPNTPKILLTQQADADAVQLVLANGDRISTDTLSFVHTDETEFSGQGGMLHVSSNETSNSSEQHKIIVPYKKKYQVVLSDGSKVFLNAGSTLTFPATFAPNQRKVQLEGEAYFEITHAASRPFIVETQQQQIQVHGTIFNVKAYQDEPMHYTTLLEGKVSLRNSNVQQELFLIPGEQAQYDVAARKTLVKPANLPVATGWKDGWLAFDNMPMDEILRQIGRWYNLEIGLIDHSLQQISLSGKIILYPDVKDVLQKFEKLGDIQFETSKKQILAKHIDNTIKQ